MEPLVLVREAAEHLRVKEPTLRRWIDDGLLPAYKLGDRVLRLRREDLEEFVSASRLEVAFE